MRIVVADVREILVQWRAGSSISGIAHTLGCSRTTVRKYVQAGQHVGLVRGSRRIDKMGWERTTRAAIADVHERRRTTTVMCSSLMSRASIDQMAV